MNIRKGIALFLFCSSTLMFANLAQSSTIMQVDYLVAGEVGDTWTYEDIYGDQFTWGLSEITSGPNAGRMKVGNDTTGIVYSVSGNSVTWYELDNSPSEKPVTFSESYETGVHYILDDSNTKDSELLFLTLLSITVQAGTFEDILVHVWLDSDYLPNDKNDLFGLGAYGITAGVTDVDWWAKDIGLVKVMGVQAENGGIDGGYELISVNVSEPETFALFLLSLGSLMIFGKGSRRKSTSHRYI